MVRPLQTPPTLVSKSSTHPARGHAANSNAVQPSARTTRVIATGTIQSANAQSTALCKSVFAMFHDAEAGSARLNKLTRTPHRTRSRNQHQEQREERSLHDERPRDRVCGRVQRGAAEDPGCARGVGIAAQAEDARDE